jgi:hypothetical protein
MSPTLDPKLREAKAARQCPVASAMISNDPFQAEANCVSYLLGRWQRKECSCPRCGTQLGYWLPSRQRWQCAGCHHQVSLEGV